MADTRVGWEGELGRWLKPFLERLGHKAAAADVPGLRSGVDRPG